MTLLLQLRCPETEKVPSWQVLRLIFLSLLQSRVHWTATPNGVSCAPGILGTTSGRNGIIQWYFTSFENAVSSAAAFSGTAADLWCGIPTITLKQNV